MDKQPNEMKDTIKTNNLKICSWNIKRGLVTKEIELCDMLFKEEFDVVFLNETDTKQIITAADYLIKGYDIIIII